MEFDALKDQLSLLESAADQLERSDYDLSSLLQQLELDSSLLNTAFSDPYSNIINDLQSSFKSVDVPSNLSSSDVTSLTVPFTPSSTHVYPKEIQVTSTTDAPTPTLSKSINTDSTHSNPPYSLSQSQIQEILTSSTFKNFLSKSSAIVERSICNSQTQRSHASSLTTFKPISSSLSVKAVYTFPEEFSSYLPCHVSFSTADPSMFLVSATPTTIPSSHPGLVLVYSLNRLSSPEFLLSSPSPVVTAFFNPNRPTLVVGACKNGQIHIWDISKPAIHFHTPTLSSFPSESDHMCPIVCLLPNFPSIGDVLSIGFDGQICSRLLEKKSLPILSCSINNDDDYGFIQAGCRSTSGLIVVGNNHGDLYKLTLSQSRISSIKRVNRAYDSQQDSSRLRVANGVAITVSCPKYNDMYVRQDCTELVLVGFLNWSWHIYDLNHENTDPILIGDDYNSPVMIAKWSPACPGVFAVGDGQGKVEIWNLGVALDRPVDCFQIGKVISSLDWSYDGSLLCVVDESGVTNVLEGLPTTTDVEKLKSSLRLVSR
ncbi:hypothetical protein GEMRC1_011980 [Eukaryota sp. GEM-RC1]